LRCALAKFLIYSGAGTALWTLLLAYLGRLLGQNYQVVEKYIGPVAYVVLGALLVIAIFWVMRRRGKRA
jgi:membrane protein DedA with SNARE-associated domain